MTQKAMKARIQKVYRKPGGFHYIPKNWPDTLWNLPTSEIVTYIENRFDDTQDEIEYYTCLVYLVSGNKHDDLLIEWKDSENYRRFLTALEEEDKKSATVEPVKKDGIKVKKSPEKSNKINKDTKKFTIKNKKVDKKVLKNVSITTNFI